MNGADWASAPATFVGGGVAGGSGGWGGGGMRRVLSDPQLLRHLVHCCHQQWRNQSLRHQEHQRMKDQQEQQRKSWPLVLQRVARYEMWARQMCSDHICEHTCEQTRHTCCSLVAPAC